MNGHLYETVIYRGETLWYEDDNGEIGNSVIIANDFELIEEQQDIDIEELKERIKKLEKKLDRFEYFAKRVEEIDASKGIFRYC